MSDDTERLLPCPFCGAAPKLHDCDWCEPVEWSVICACGSSIHGSTDKAVAIAAWNKRLDAATSRNEGRWQPTHRHYKGALYRRLGLVRNSEDWDGERETLYQNEAGEFVRRPTVMFDETMPDGRKRFDPLPKDACPSAPSEAEVARVAKLLCRLDVLRNHGGRGTRGAVDEHVNAMWSLFKTDARAALAAIGRGEDT